MTRFVVALDIDCTLTDPISSYLGDEASLPSWAVLQSTFPILSDFNVRQMVIEAPSLVWNLIFPGVIEMLQWLHEKKIHFVFCSLGIAERNQELVRSLLILALGEEIAQQYFSRPFILSREDFMDTPSLSVHPKDLNRLFTTGCLSDAQFSLNDIILVDDCAHSMARDQEHNLLLVKNTTFMDFHIIQLNACGGQISPEDLAASIKSARVRFYIVGVLSCLLKMSGASATADLQTILREQSNRPELNSSLEQEGLNELRTINSDLMRPTERAVFAEAYVPNTRLWADVIVEETDNRTHWGRRCPTFFHDEDAQSRGSSFEVDTDLDEDEGPLCFSRSLSPHT